MDNPFIWTKPYYESGFNGQPWTKSFRPEFDQFYFYIEPILSSQSILNELEASLNILNSRIPELTIVDDGSTESQILMRLAPAMPIVPLATQHEPSQEFIHLCSAQYQIDNAEMIFALSWAHSLKKPLLFSKWQMRILNINFFRTKNQALGKPYYVYVENERFHKLRVAQKELNIPFSWNFLNSSPSLFRSFFFHNMTQAWLHESGQAEAHNYHSEQSIFSDILKNLGGKTSGENHSWGLGSWSHSLKNSSPVQQASFPIHLLFEKVFHENSNLNVRERSLYGS
jgi:hypothetical protein